MIAVDWGAVLGAVLALWGVVYLVGQSDWWDTFRSRGRHWFLVPFSARTGKQCGTAYDWPSRTNHRGRTMSPFKYRDEAVRRASEINERHERHAEQVGQPPQIWLLVRHRSELEPFDFAEYLRENA